jgi:hypothetical protein
MSSKVPVPGDTVIAVMGVTGAGKSSFIKNVTGNASIQIGHGLDSRMLTPLLANDHCKQAAHGSRDPSC